MKTRSQEYEEKRQKRNKIIVSSIMASIMIFSSIAYAVLYLTEGQSSTRYNGFHIKQVFDQSGAPNGYSVKLQGEQRQFFTTPQDSLDIQVPLGFIEAVKNTNGLVFLFDPKDNMTPTYDQLRYLFTKDLPSSLLQGSAITQESNVYNLPIMNCSQVPQGYIIILLTQGNKSITQNQGCAVFAGASGPDFALLHDRFLYAYYGVTQ